MVEEDVLDFLRVRNHAGLERHQGWLALPISAYFCDFFYDDFNRYNSGLKPPENCPLILLIDEFQDLSRCNYDFLVESLPSIRKMLVGDGECCLVWPRCLPCPWLTHLSALTYVWPDPHLSQTTSAFTAFAALSAPLRKRERQNPVRMNSISLAAFASVP